VRALETYLPFVEAELRRLAFADEVLGEAAAYALDGGKHLRPCLLLMTADAAGGDWRGLGAAAAAVECIHAYSLVHDDLPAMDDDDLRHGKPTLHRAFGEAPAILTGDGLLTMAFELLARRVATCPAELQLLAVREVAQGAGFGAGMVGGQALDLAGAQDEERWLQVAAAKTGHPLGAAAAAGALLAGRQDLAAPFRTFGQELGIAFQIKDDLLDVQGSEAAMGKRLRKDEDKRRPNLPAIIGVDRAEAALEAHSDRALAALAEVGMDRALLRLLVGELRERSR